jgi:hypothetical protein
MLRQYQQEIARLRAELARPEHQTPFAPVMALPEPPPAPLMSSPAEVQTDALVEADTTAAHMDAAAGPAEPSAGEPPPWAADEPAECTVGSPLSLGMGTEAPMPAEVHTLHMPVQWSVVTGCKPLQACSCTIFTSISCAAAAGGEPAGAAGTAKAAGREPNQAAGGGQPGSQP